MRCLCARPGGVLAACASPRFHRGDEAESDAPASAVMGGSRSPGDDAGDVAAAQ